MTMTWFLSHSIQMVSFQQYMLKEKVHSPPHYRHDRRHGCLSQEHWESRGDLKGSAAALRCQGLSPAFMIRSSRSAHRGNSTSAAQRVTVAHNMPTFTAQSTSKVITSSPTFQKGKHPSFLLLVNKTVAGGGISHPHTTSLISQCIFPYCFFFLPKPLSSYSIHFFFFLTAVDNICVLLPYCPHRYAEIATGVRQYGTGGSQPWHILPKQNTNLILVRKMMLRFHTMIISLNNQSH